MRWISLVSDPDYGGTVHDQTDMSGSDRGNGLDHDPSHGTDLDPLASFVRIALPSPDLVARRVPFVPHACAHVRPVFYRRSLSS